MAKEKTEEEEFRIIKVREGRVEAVEFRTAARRTGSSLGIIVPSHLRRTMRLEEDDPLIVTIARAEEAR